MVQFTKITKSKETVGGHSGTPMAGMYVPMADVTMADVPMADVTIADVPMADMTMADVPMADVQNTGLQENPTQTMERLFPHKEPGGRSDC